MEETHPLDTDEPYHRRRTHHQRKRLVIKSRETTTSRRQPRAGSMTARHAMRVDKCDNNGWGGGYARGAVSTGDTS